MGTVLVSVRGSAFWSALGTTSPSLVVYIEGKSYQCALGFAHLSFCPVIGSITMASCRLGYLWLSLRKWSFAANSGGARESSEEQPSSMIRFRIP